MENEIKVNEYARTFAGYIFKVLKISEEDKLIYYYGDQPEWIGEWKENIIKHSPNLIDLIECGDYVNGYIVRRTYLDGAIHYIKLGEQITGNRTYNDDIKTIVTKEMIESISYKVTKM